MTFELASGTRPYDHTIYMTTLVYITTIFFDPDIKITESSYYFEDPINVTLCCSYDQDYGPTVVTLTRFHCIGS